MVTISQVSTWFCYDCSSYINILMKIDELCFAIYYYFFLFIILYDVNYIVLLKFFFFFLEDYSLKYVIAVLVAWSTQPAMP